MAKQKYQHLQHHSIRKLQAVKICPVTNGLPTTMTLEGFKAACESCQDQSRTGWGYQRTSKNTWCDTCQGEKLPSELRVVSLAQLKNQQAAKKYEKSREMQQHSPAR